MCLDFDWFSLSDNRRFQREKYGLSISEAESCLKCYNSTVYPIANEVADFIRDHRASEQIDMLNLDAQKALFVCLGRK